MKKSDLQPLYEIKQLSYRYHLEPVLRIEELTIMPSSITGLIGPNGSGKSTLLKIMAFIKQPSRGKIFFKGQTTSQLDKSTRLNIALLTQKTHLMKRTVYQNITYGLKVRHIDKKYHLSAARKALKMVGLNFDIFATRLWNTLSGGEAQRVALAARLIFKPQVLLMDEPTANIDSPTSELIKKISTTAKRKWNTTLVIASHDIEWLSSICDKTLFLVKGQLITENSNNIIMGPWRRINNKISAKYIHKGQYLFVSHPPSKDSIAVIEPTDIRISNHANHHNGKHILHGKIKQLRSENSNNDISVQVNIGSLTLITTIRTDQLLEMTLYPGKKIDIMYSPQYIHWR